MRRELLEVLACPEDQEALNLNVTEEVNGDIKQGTLTCQKCSQEYQIKNGIPILYFNKDQTVIEQFWELSDAPLIDHNFMRGIEVHKQPIRIRIRDEAVAIGKSVLDVGCATCIDYPLYQEIGYRYVGVDLTYKLLLGALKNSPDVPVVQGDGKKLPFKNESFDSTYCKDMLIHLPPGDYAKVLTDMWRVTKKALMIGFFGNSVDYRTECDYRVSAINPKVGYNYASYWSYYTKEAIQNVLKNLPNFDTLQIDHVKFEGHEESTDSRTFYKALKKTN